MTPGATMAEPAGHPRELSERWSEALTWVGGLVWPGAVVVETRHGGQLPEGLQRVARFIPVAVPRRPLVLAPDAPRAATAQALRHYWPASSATGYLGRGFASGLSRTGLLAAGSSRRVQIARRAGSDSDGHVPEAVAAALGWSGVITALSAPLQPRAHHKPVLLLLSATGAALGFAKVGWNEATRHEVLREAGFLAQLDGRRFDTMNVPALLHAASLGDREVIAVAALPAEGRPPATSLETVAAAREVTTLFGTYDARLAGSAFLARILDRLADIPAPEAEVVRRATERLATSAPDMVVQFGAWHGDWRPQNMAHAGDKLDVWDWERAATDVPVGFDIIHWEFQSAYWSKQATVAEAVHTCQRRAAQVLPRLGVTTGVALLVDLYLLELVAMLLADHRGMPAGHALRQQCHALLTWLANGHPARAEGHE